MSDSTVLVVEDDDHIGDLVELYLTRDGHKVVRAGDAEAGLRMFAHHRPRLVVLDVGLPGDLDGFDVLRELRVHNARLPIMMLTARDDEIDRVLGFELGADDYVLKPFSPRELAARVKAILRRAAPPAAADDVLTVGGVVVDVVRREARRGDTDPEIVRLTAREFDLLRFLAVHVGQALSRQQLLDGVWGPEWYGDERTVDVHVRQLRRKLGDDLPLDTVWGVGYRLG